MRRLIVPFTFFVALVLGLAASAQTPFTNLVLPPRTVLGNPTTQSDFGQAVPFSVITAGSGSGVVPLPVASGGTNCIAASGTCLDNITGFAGTGFIRRSGGVYGFIADPLPLTNGGSAASLTASNGGLVYSTGSAMAILAGTATAGQIPRSGSNAAPSWSTATYPATTTINQVLYSNAANTITGLATANRGVLATDAGGVPSITSQPTLGVNGGTGGQIALNGATSGTVTIVPQAAAGTATFTLPNASGTPAISVPSPLSLSAVTGAATWSGLTSDGIMFASSATAVATNRCTMDTNQSIVCTSAANSTPVIDLTNTASDSASAFFRASKSRAGGNSLSGDSLFQLVGRGFANAAYQNSADILMSQAAASSGSVVPSKMQFFTTRAAAFDVSMTLDNNGHYSFATTAPPTAGTCAGFALASGSSDVAGRVTYTSATTCTITFGVAYAVAPFCQVTPGTAASTVLAVPSTTQLAVTFGTAQTSFAYQCYGA